MLGQGYDKARCGLDWLVQEQRLARSAGRAVAALLGNMLPATEPEDRLVDRIRDEILKNGRSMISEATAEAKHYAGHGVGRPCRGEAPCRREGRGCEKPPFSPRAELTQAMAGLLAGLGGNTPGFIK